MTNIAGKQVAGADPSSTAVVTPEHGGVVTAAVVAARIPALRLRIRNAYTH